MFEALGQLAHGARKLTRYCIAPAARRRRMVSFIENQQRARAEFAKKIPQSGDIVFLSQQAMGNDEARASTPGIDRKPAKTPKFTDALAIDDVERQAELAFEFVPPLDRHGRRSCDNDKI